jgi:predicted 2-oxoglutarate/Fe(II)-dependent dioxygenase YbiX
MKNQRVSQGGSAEEPFGGSSRVRLIVPGLPRRAVMPGDTLDFAQPFVWTVDGVLDAAERSVLVERTEAIGFSAAPITTARGFEMRPDIRNNRRVMFDDEALARDLFERLRAFVPREMFGRSVCGANERFRVYRYEAGECFRPHFDGAFARDEREASELTLMVYLNDGFEGGETRFHDFDETITPRAGTALLFQHRLLHEGAPVRSGVKYVLRTDVMYRTNEDARKEHEHG